MTWLTAAFIFVFVSNFLFLAGAAGLMMKILNGIEATKLQITKSLGQSQSATADLARAARRVADEWAEYKLRTPAADSAPVNEDLSGRLREKLKETMTDNLRLRTEMDATRKQLLLASDPANNPDTIALKETARRCDELQRDLAAAQQRMRNAEKAAEQKALQVEELKDALSVKNLSDLPPNARQLEKLQDSNERLLNSEKTLLTRIDLLEVELKRHLTEKAFIEDRFLRLDAVTPRATDSPV